MTYPIILRIHYPRCDTIELNGFVYVIAKREGAANESRNCIRAMLKCGFGVTR
jgi:hypothetical protein